MNNKTQIKDSYQKLTWSEFLKQIRREMPCYLGLSQVYHKIHTCLDSDPQQIILITGESGVGKELIARAIHKHGDRANKPFVFVDCGRTEKELLESKLFGHIKGAFTGAHKVRHGVFEQANEGVLFLDEIANLSFEAQAKLMRVIEDRKIVRLGDDEEKLKKVDVKIIVGTNKNLLLETKNSNFRDDLYYRVKGFPIEVEPLRERYPDIPVLIRFFIEEKNERTGKNIDALQFKLFLFCITYDWEGNVRDLANFIDLCYTNCKSGEALRLENGYDFFSDQKYPERWLEGIGDWEKIMMKAVSPPINYFEGVLIFMGEQDQQELRKLIPFERKEFGDNKIFMETSGKEFAIETREPVITGYNIYPDIKLTNISDGKRIRSAELWSFSDVPDAPGCSPDVFWRKVNEGKLLSEAEERYLNWVRSSQYEEWKRTWDEDKNYEGFVTALKRLYEKNKRSLKLLWFLKSQAYQKEKDFFNLPHQKAMFEFEKEWIKRALERNKGNKTQTAKEMGLNVETLRQKLKKLNL
jgi:DNA-binding NtrC family response regulator